MKHYAWLMINSVSAEISTILTPCKENPIDDWRIFSLRKVFKEPEKVLCQSIKNSLNSLTSIKENKNHMSQGYFSHFLIEDAENYMTLIKNLSLVKV